MNDVYDLARKLGDEILNSDAAKKLQKAKENYYNDKDAVSLIKGYEDTKNEYHKKLFEVSSTKEEYETFEEILSTLNEAISQNAVISDFIAAEAEFVSYAKSVISIVNSTVSEVVEFSSFCDSHSCGGGCC